MIMVSFWSLSCASDMTEWLADVESEICNVRLAVLLPGTLRITGLTWLTIITQLQRVQILLYLWLSLFLRTKCMRPESAF